MNTILVVGMTGQGKTTWLKKFVKGRKVYVFDVNDEYKGLPRDCNLIHENFVSHCLENVTGTNICFEDATGFFQGKVGSEMTRLIVQKRHAKNNIILLFHSIADIPPKMARLANYLVLFNTNDEQTTVKGKFPSLYRLWFHYHATKEKSHVYNGSQIYKPQVFKLI